MVYLARNDVERLGLTNLLFSVIERDAYVHPAVTRALELT